jgi:hypothetical protein
MDEIIKYKNLSKPLQFGVGAVIFNAAVVFINLCIEIVKVMIVIFRSYM